MKILFGHGAAQKGLIREIDLLLIKINRRLISKGREARIV